MRGRVGDYEVVRELGRGGMGVVYEVRDPAVERTLAAKVVLRRADPEALARFRREAELLARVRHPGVVVVHGLVETPEGERCLVTDLVPGASLEEVGPLAPRRAAEVVRDLADAVEALHRAGVLHRDLKPSNVLLRPDGRPVLVDFGLARLAAGPGLTESGAVLGTPGYLAPEQARGEPPGAGTDVHGLGAVLFALLAGRPPFEALSEAAALYAAATREPRWPDAPPGLLAVLRRSLAKEPAARQPSAAALRDELDGWLRADAARPDRARGRGLAVVVGLALGAAALAGRELAPRPGPRPAGPPAVAPPAGEPPRTAATPRDPISAWRRALAAPRPDAALLEARRARPLATLEPRPRPAPSVEGRGERWAAAAFVDEHVLAVVRRDEARLRLWDVRGAAARDLELPAPGHAVAVGGRTLAVAGRSSVHVLDLDRLDLAPRTVWSRSPPKGAAELRAVAVAADGSCLVAAGEDVPAVHVDLRATPPRATTIKDPQGTRVAALVARGSGLEVLTGAGGDRDLAPTGRLVLWTPGPALEARPVLDLGLPPSALAVAPGEVELLAAVGDLSIRRVGLPFGDDRGALRPRDLAGPEAALARPRAHESFVVAVAWTARTRAWSLSRGHRERPGTATLRCWELPAGGGDGVELRRVPLPRPALARSLAVSGDGALAAVGFEDGAVEVLAAGD